MWMSEHPTIVLLVLALAVTVTISPIKYSAANRQAQSTKLLVVGSTPSKLE